VFSVLVLNKCSYFELVSPTYFGHNAIWYIPPDQKVDTNAATKASFGRDVTKDEFINALIYKLQRKKCSESNDQSSADSAFTEDTSANIQLLVIWSLNKYEIYVRALLIKHNNTIIWNEDTLEKLQSMYLAPHRDNYDTKDTWLLDDATMLMTTLKWKKMRHTTEIIITEGIKEDDSMEPLWIPSSI
jgi:hypothetical protein